MLSRPLIREGKSYAPRAVRDFKLVPYAAGSVSRLRSAGYMVVVVTNQPDIGNGLVRAEVVEQMHRILRERVPVDDVFTCPHTQLAQCFCRKPQAGMLREAAERYGLDLGRSFIVGDRASDIQAGAAAGCRTIFIDRHYAEAPPSSADFTTSSLKAATDLILSHPTPAESSEKN